MLEKKIRIISAGAGSGKTHRLTEELSGLLSDKNSGIRPEGVVATTFTRKAAAELVERLRQSLFEKNKPLEAERISAGFIGTINSICGALLKQVAFEAGVSPQLEVIADEDQQIIFNQALAEVVNDDGVTILEELGERLGSIGWKEALKNIVDAARSNNCQPGDLDGFAQQSISGLKAFLPVRSKQTAEALDKALARAVGKAVREIKGNVADGTAGTRKYLEELEGFESSLKAGVLLPWTDWVGLATKSPTKASAGLAEPVKNAAAPHATHPRFHDDLETYIATLFKLAASVIERYQAYKRERGLMDFVDQESGLLAALDLPEVQQRLQEGLDLLLVDEFQDTSPIQLALFLKLTALVRQSVWVGDPKQSIYAFRGADPALMAAVSKAVPIQPGDVQTTSYRSRPDLVRFANGLFVPAFAGILPREQVELKPYRTDAAAAAAALRIWPLGSGNGNERIEVIANGIAGMIAEAPVVLDKATGQERKARGGDIAVLCRSHDVCRDIAKALAKRGVRVAIGRPGLLDTPEGKLVTACLRYFQNEHDTLANAEIQVLTSADPNPEEWLADRFTWLETGNKSHEWGGGHKVLTALKILSSRAIDYSPSETLDEIIESIDLRRLLMGWGEKDRRLGNLENLRQMVRTYEDSCRRQMSAATVSGFLLWLAELAGIGKDSQAEGYGADAVSILTCHAAKGLEWPIEVAATLDSKPRERVWDVTVIDDRTHVSLTAPLAGRWIRFWPWPYGKKSNNTGLKEKMQGSPVMTQATASAEAEELRLLYVTLTRARDYQVLCVNGKGVHWLELALNKAKLALPSLEEEKTVSVDWEGKGKALKFQVQFPKPAAANATKIVSDQWVSERTGAVPCLPAKLNPSAMKLFDGATVLVGKPIVTGKMLQTMGKPSYQYLGLALHGFIAVDHAGTNTPEERVFLLEGLLARHGVSGAVVTADLLDNCDGFYRFIAGLKPGRILTEWPMQMKVGDQLMVGTADMLFDSPDGWIVVDHKSFPGPQSLWAPEAEGYAGQLKAYSDALTLATGRPVAGAYINFVVGGGVVELKVR